MEKTNITIEELKKLTDEQIIIHGKKFKYPTQWLNKDALGWFNYHLSLMTGRIYSKIGNKSVFRVVNF